MSSINKSYIPIVYLSSAKSGLVNASTLKPLSSRINLNDVEYLCHHLQYILNIAFHSHYTAHQSRNTKGFYIFLDQQDLIVCRMELNTSIYFKSRMQSWLQLAFQSVSLTSNIFAINTTVQ
jgi:hypothetical protein